MKNKGKVFLLDDEELIVAVLSKALRKEGYEIVAETETGGIVDKIKSCNPDLLLMDIRMPDRDGIDILKELKEDGLTAPVVMLTADDTAETAVRAMKLGASDYLTKPFNTDEVKIVIRNIIEKENLRQEVDYLRKAYSEVMDREMVGESSVIRELEGKIQKIARARVSNILVTGESGTGKELVARRIHKLMFNADNSWDAPFISVNCAAMPESLLESQLFGYEKGAFTDAKSDKKGLFEMAKGGAILLDEIGDMKPDLQSKLLRVLEERKIRRIGGKGEIAVEAAVIATTNRNLSEAVSKGEFRKDLFFRLTTFYLHVLPLRERQDDIPLLANYFLAHFAKKYNKKIIKGFTPQADELMINYAWPGNIRELKNLVERLVVLEDAEVIAPEHMPKWIFGDTLGAKQPAGDKISLPDAGISLEQVEKDLIRQALEKSNYNKTLAAKLLDITYDTLRYQVKKYGLE
ncbi:MAG: sigma-54 dependent transcriptional regulator [Desulfobacterales bacterium]|jgi:DNA-binding NtrC family response regulator